MPTRLHLICLDSPFSQSYGGVIDIAGKLKAFKKAGISICLHVFHKKNVSVPHRSEWTETIYSYPRTTGFSFGKPHIVSSRESKKLIENLSRDNDPILIEGIHCCGILSELNRSSRKIVVRIHNDEAAYYTSLYQSSGSLLRRIYFKRESILLKNFQNELPKEIDYACLNECDIEAFREQYGLEKLHFVPVFVDWEKSFIPEKQGYCLYHGNLSVPENEKAAIWLMEEVFNDDAYPLLIAGRDPGRKLSLAIQKRKSITLVSNPDEENLRGLIENAQLHVLPSFNTTGTKLKLLHAVARGGHCLVNDAMVAGTRLEGTCIKFNTATQLKELISIYLAKPFSRDDWNEREKLLDTWYNNDRNIRSLISLLF